MDQSISPTKRLWSLVQEKRSDITAIYFFALLSGLIQLSLPLGIQAIIGFVLGGTLSSSLVVLITILIVAVCLTGVLRINQMRVIERVQQRLFVKYSFAFADRIPRLDLKRVDGFYLPELVNRFFDTMILQKGFSKLLLDVPAAAIQILLGLIVLSFYHPFFILFGILLLLLLWLILHVTSSKGLNTSLQESAHKYGVAGWLEEMARMVTSFKFSDSDLHLKKADEKTIAYLNTRTQHFKVLELQYKILIAFKVLITAAMLIGGVVLLINQQINIGQFVAAEIIILAVIASVEKIIINLDSVYDVLTAVEKINKLIDKPIESTGNYQAPNRSIGVSAKNLCFEYEPGKKIINNASFSIEAGEKVCIKGSPGTGKSTLLKLISGVFTDYTGSLSLNNVPLPNYDLMSLRNKIGILFAQETIFHGTLWENLTMDREHTDHEYIGYLCEQAGLLPFPENLPNGYDTKLDPTGKRLPRTVIQKILLVRAFAHKPDLMILENPFFGIDNLHKENMKRLLLSNKATVIVATNDVEFAKSCDKIIDLDKN